MDILLIDDDDDVRTSVASFISKLGHEVQTAADGAEGLKMFDSSPFDLIITDIRMPVMNGIELLQSVKRDHSRVVEVVIITGHGDMDNAVDALRYGAYDYLQKPIEVRELAAIVQRCAELTALRKKYLDLKSNFDLQLRQELNQCIDTNDIFRSAFFREVGLDKLKYNSAEMQRVIELTERFSRDRNLPVLIEGESGTGKELIARLTHYFSMVDDSLPFVAINCGAISPELFEAELFGHEGGAYTGASKTSRKGKFAAADNGTLFLDEIGEIPLAMQVKLLRVLEEKCYYPIGSTKEVEIDVRIVAATNKNLKEEVKEGRFRLDLFHRLSVGHLVIPPLRQRKADILLLAHHFIRRACSRYGVLFDNFSPDAEKLLTKAKWPGNVRQLKNAMSRLALLSSNGYFDTDDLQFISDDDEVYDNGDNFEVDIQNFKLPDEYFDLNRFVDTIIEQALEKQGGNKTKTAEYLGISRRVLQGKLQNKGS